QETFLRAYRAWEQYTPGTRAKSWLFTICRNIFLRQRERSVRHDEIVQQAAGRTATAGAPPAEGLLFAATAPDDPEGSFFRELVDESIFAAIDELPQEFRDVVVLSDLEGLAYAEIAEVLDIPVGTVKSRLFRGRRQLQEKLYAYAVEYGYIKPRAKHG